MKAYNSVEVMGYRVFSDNLASIPLRDGDQARVINTISPNSYGLCTCNPELDRALKQSDYLVLDGVYFAIASILLEGKNIRRNQGPDVFYHFLDRLNIQGGKAFFLGSTERTLTLIRERVSRDYPNVQAFTYSPPFRQSFTSEDNEAMIREVNTVNPDILFVGMTCPKQETWSMQHRALLKAGVVICIGNVFDWFAGTQKPIHPIWFRLRVGWLVRIIQRPEIFRRNIGNQMRFFRDTFRLFLSRGKKRLNVAGAGSQELPVRSE